MKKIQLLIYFLLSSFCVYSQSGLPQLDINKATFDFGKTLLMEKKSQQVVFKNVGDTVLTIYHIDSLKHPFYGTFHYPDTLEQGDSVYYRISYIPQESGKDSQRVFLRADTRLSHSIGMLFDISPSMDEDMPDERVSRIDAARSAARILIQSMISTPKVQDEAGIFSFWSSFRVNQDFTSNKSRLLNALPSTNWRYTGTAFYDACAEVINRLKNRPYIKVLIALTDGEDNRSNSYNANSIINLAKKNNIKVYTIGLGSTKMDATLNRIAKETSGQFFDARTRKDLENVYYEIFSLLSKNVEVSFDIIGHTPPPVLTLDCPIDTIQHTPGDTISYSVFLDEIKSVGVQNKKYELVLWYNTSMLFPLDEEEYKYNSNGSVSFFDTVEVNLDSFALKTIRFLTLVGDEKCTDIYLDKIIWDDDYYGEIKSGDLCDICIYACAIDIRQVVTLRKNALYQNHPNPAQGNTSIDFVVAEQGVYKLELFDIFGNSVSTVVDKNLLPGKYSYSINISNLSAGYYFYSLTSPTETQTKTMIIVD